VVKHREIEKRDIFTKNIMKKAQPTLRIFSLWALRIEAVVTDHHLALLRDVRSNPGNEFHVIHPLKL